MEIIESIIHRIDKAKDTQGPNSTKTLTRTDLLPINDQLNLLGSEILKLYGRLSNGYGKLGTEFAIHRFPNFFKQHVERKTDLVAFSTLTTELIAEAMRGHPWITTSYPFFIRYANQGREWMLVAVLKLKSGVGIDDKTLELSKSLSFDISDLKEAARIDIEKWGRDEQPYLSFIKRGSSGDVEVSKYFRNSLSCLEYTDSTHNTETAVKAIKEYCQENDYNDERRREIRTIMFDYCSEKKRDDQPVNLVSLSALIDDQDPEAFIRFVREKEYEVNETFSPSPTVYKKMRRVSKKFGTIGLSFEISDIYDGNVKYNLEANKIEISNPPNDLIVEINNISNPDD